MAVVPGAGEPLSPQAAGLARRIARVFLDEPAGLMAEVHAAVICAAGGLDHWFRPQWRLRRNLCGGVSAGHSFPAGPWRRSEHD
jgi:hypothetical protein